MEIRHLGWQAFAASLLYRAAFTISTFLAILVLVGGFPTRISPEGALPAHEAAFAAQEPAVSAPATAHAPSHAGNPFVTVVTAYSSTPEETDGDPFITASGRRVRPGIVACSRRYPFGTRFLIQGQVYVCLDRLAPRYDHRIDIWKPSKLEALNFGKQQLKVRILLDEA